MSDIGQAVEAAGGKRLQIVEERCPHYKTGRVEEFSAFADWGIGPVVTGSYDGVYCTRTGGNCNSNPSNYKQCSTYLRD